MHHPDPAFGPCESRQNRWMDEVTVAAGGTSIAFHSAEREGGDPYSAGRFQVEAATEGLRIERSVDR